MITSAKSMKVLVTGPDGLLGSNLVRELLGRGFSVRALIQPKSRSHTLDGLPIERCDGDILDPSSLKEAIRDREVVFHCAALTNLWPPRAPWITEVNVEGTRNILKAVMNSPVKRLVHVGSASSFGFGPKENPGTEESPYLSGRFHMAYMDSKHTAQEMVRQHAQEGKLDAVIVNPTFMIGPFDSGPSSGELILGFIKRKLPFYPPGGRNFVHARDAAKGMIAALEKGRIGENYILGHQNLSYQEFFSKVASIAGIKPPKLQAPKPLILLAGLAGSAFGTISGRTPLISYMMAKISCLGNYYSPAKAVRELGLPQTPIETAIEDAYRWFKDNGYL